MKASAIELDIGYGKKRVGLGWLGKFDLFRKKDNRYSNLPLNMYRTQKIEFFQLIMSESWKPVARKKEKKSVIRLLLSSKSSLSLLSSLHYLFWFINLCLISLLFSVPHHNIVICFCFFVHQLDLEHLPYFMLYLFIFIFVLGETFPSIIENHFV